MADELIIYKTDDGKVGDSPDYAAMRDFISVVQKLVIKDVVKYADQKIAATKLITNNE